MELLRMLAPWTRARRADGVELAGPGGAAIVLRPAVAPIPTLRAVIDAELGPGAPAARLARLATLEGEPAAVAAGAGWAIGIAVGDAAAALAIGRGPGVADPVEALVRHAFLGHGEVRRRRYVYAPPPGWRGLARPHAARWLPPDFPRRPHALTVLDARPLAATEPERADRLLLTDAAHGRDLLPPRPLAPARAAGGLTGTYARIDYLDRGARRSIVRAALRDERFLYAAELSGPSDGLAASLPALEAVVASIEAIPRPAVTDRRDRVLYWGD